MTREVRSIVYLLFVFLYLRSTFLVEKDTLVGVRERARFVLGVHSYLGSFAITQSYYADISLRLIAS